MSKQVMIDLMTRLSKDRKECHEFREDPDRFMVGLDLTEQEKELLRHVKRQEIQAYFGPETYYCEICKE